MEEKITLWVLRRRDLLKKAEEREIVGIYLTEPQNIPANLEPDTFTLGVDEFNTLYQVLDGPVVGILVQHRVAVDERSD